MNPGMVLLNMFFTFIFLVCLTLICFFTIFNLKLSDYLQLVPRHTDCVTFSSITGFCSKIIVSYLFHRFDYLIRRWPASTTWLSWER